jgi:hypothetical protein
VAMPGSGAGGAGASGAVAFFKKELGPTQRPLALPGSIIRLALRRELLNKSPRVSHSVLSRWLPCLLA